MDPCAALHVKFDLLDGAEKEIIFQVGNETNTHEANVLIKKFSDKDVVAQSLHDVKKYWKEVVNAVQVKTPDQFRSFVMCVFLILRTVGSSAWCKNKKPGCWELRPGGVKGF